MHSDARSSTWDDRIETIATDLAIIAGTGIGDYAKNRGRWSPFDSMLAVANSLRIDQLSAVHGWQRDIRRRLTNPIPGTVLDTVFSDLSSGGVDSFLADSGLKASSIVSTLDAYIREYLPEATAESALEHLTPEDDRYLSVDRHDIGRLDAVLQKALLDYCSASFEQTSLKKTGGENQFDATLLESLKELFPIVNARLVLAHNRMGQLFSPAVLEESRLLLQEASRKRYSIVSLAGMCLRQSQSAED